MSSIPACRLFVVCLVTSLSLASAQTTVRHHHTPTPTPSPTGTDQAEDGPDFDGVQFVDKKLNTMVTVEKVNTELSPSKLLTIYVDLKNKTHKALDLQIQTSYADVRNTPLSSADSWVDFNLKARDQDEYCSVALSADAVKYAVKIRLEPADGNAGAGPGNTIAQLTTPTPAPDATPTPTSTVADNTTPTTPTPTSTLKPRQHISLSDTLP